MPRPTPRHAGVRPWRGRAVCGGAARRPAPKGQSFSAAETLPPFLSSSSMTRLWSQISLALDPVGKAAGGGCRKNEREPGRLPRAGAGGD